MRFTSTAKETARHNAEAPEPAAASAVANHDAPTKGSVFMPVQCQLSVGSAGDPLEEEADNTADRIMRSPANPFIQRSADGAGMAVSNDTAAGIAAQRGGGAALDGPAKSFMEQRFRQDFSDVRIHDDAPAAQLSQDLGAQAFTLGRDVFFNSGKFAPDTDDGKHLLAHELTHTIQQGGDTLRRVPMPADAAVTNLESYTAGTRQDTHYDSSFHLQNNIALFFQPSLNTAVRAGYNVSYVLRGFPAAEAWVGDALSALALYNFNLNSSATEAPLTGITTVQHLDLSGQTNTADATQHGPNALIRFTTTSFDATTAANVTTRNIQVLIEKQGDFAATAATETAPQRATRYATSYQISNAQPVNNDPLADLSLATMTDAQFDVVLSALDRVPASVLSRATGIPIYRSDAARGPGGEIAEYSQSKPSGATVWQRRITAFRDFFSATAEDRAFIMAHEFGHALDFRPNETTSGHGGASLSALSERDHASFRYAVQQDGGLAKGISEYAATRTSFDEYFAEAFAMYLSQRATLRALRPNVHQYFATLYP